MDLEKYINEKREEKSVQKREKEKCPRAERRWLLLKRMVFFVLVGEWLEVT